MYCIANRIVLNFKIIKERIAVAMLNLETDLQHNDPYKARRSLATLYNDLEDHLLCMEG